MTSTNATTTSTPVKVRGVRVFRPDVRRCADPDRPVRIEIAGVAYADVNADEAGQVAAALVAAAGGPESPDPLDVACAIEFFEEHGQPLNAAAVRALVAERDNLAATVTAVKSPVPTTRVPDLPCPKCGDGDVRVRYCDGCNKRLYSDPCFHGEREHFHRCCRRCGYDWQTSDAIDANKVCKS